MIRLCTVFVLIIPFYGSAQTAAQIDSFYSPGIASIAHYSYLLPAHYDTLHSFPVLYLLHGYSGDHRNWSELTNLMTYGAELGVIIVMPNAANSWYVNSAGEPNARYEDFIINDLRTYIEHRFHVDTTRRAIAGLSMGGYGAVMLALRHPRLYRFAGSLSGTLSIPSGMEFPAHNKEERSLANLDQVFGSSRSFREEHDVLHLYKKTQRQDLPYLYFAIGTNDGFTTFLPAHRTLIDSLRSYGARYEYHETPGVHNWKYWSREIRPLLRRMIEVLDEERW